MSTAYDFVVLPSLAGSIFANRYVNETMHDTSSESLTIRRKLLVSFQRIVMDVFAECMLEVADVNDGLLNDDDPDVADTYRVYREFLSLYPKYDIIALFPIDTLGSFGFVISPKPMND